MINSQVVLRKLTPILVCICFLPLSTFAGTPKTLLLYAEDPTFLPDIVRTLSSLRDSETGQRLFSNIINLNKWAINRVDQSTLDALIRYYESPQETRKKSEETVSHDNQVAEFIKQADAYIRIDVLEKLPLIEFQLIVNDSLTEPHNGEFKTIISVDSRYEGFVIDVSVGDYAQRLEKSIKRIFPQSNKFPVPVVRLQKRRHTDGYYYFRVGQTAKLDATSSYDPDGSPGSLEFHWEQIAPEVRESPLRKDEMLAIEHDSAQQELVLPDTGEYWLQLRVSDGVVMSNPNTLKLKVARAPLLLVERYHKTETHAAFRNRRSFSVPFKVRVLSGDTFNVNVLTAQVRSKVNILDRLTKISEPDWQKVEQNRVSLNELSEKRDSLYSVHNFQLEVSYQRGAPDVCEYQFSLFAEDDRCSSDTVLVTVHHEDRSSVHRLELVTSTFYWHRDGPDVDKKVFFVQGEWRVYLRKQLSLGYGMMLPLYRENIEDSLDVFDLPTFHFTVSWRYWSFPILYTGKYVGIGSSVDWGSLLFGFPLQVEVVYYPHDIQSVSLKTSIEGSTPWFSYLMFGSYIVAASWL